MNTAAKNPCAWLPNTLISQGSMLSTTANPMFWVPFGDGHAPPPLWCIPTVTRGIGR